MGPDPPPKPEPVVDDEEALAILCYRAGLAKVLRILERAERARERGISTITIACRRSCTRSDGMNRKQFTRRLVIHVDYVEELASLRVGRSLA